MAKKKGVKSFILTEDNIDQMLESGMLKITTPPSSDDPDTDLKNKVLFFRSRGFDNNRIAALLNIQKTLIDGIE